MKTYIQEQLQNPDELLAHAIRYERAGLLKLQPFKVDQAIAHMLQMQERLGGAASNHFVPKDYTKPRYEPLPSEPATIPKKVDAFEQALIGVAASSKNTVPEIDEVVARDLVMQSLWDEDVTSEYIANGLKDLEDLANKQGQSNVH